MVTLKYQAANTFFGNKNVLQLLGNFGSNLRDVIYKCPLRKIFQFCLVWIAAIHVFQGVQKVLAFSRNNISAEHKPLFGFCLFMCLSLLVTNVEINDISSLLCQKKHSNLSLQAME